MVDEFCPKMPDFHVTFRDLLHAVNLRHGTNGFTSLPKGGLLRIFFALKNQTASAGFEPANLGILYVTLALQTDVRYGTVDEYIVMWKTRLMHNTKNQNDKRETLMQRRCEKGQNSTFTTCKWLYLKLPYNYGCFIFRIIRHSARLAFWPYIHSCLNCVITYTSLRIAFFKIFCFLTIWLSRVTHRYPPTKAFLLHKCYYWHDVKHEPWKWWHI